MSVVTVNSMSRLFGLLHRLAMDRRGVSALEAAIALPVLSLALAGVLEFGINVYNRQQLQAAVQAGVHYALRNPDNTQDIGNTVLGALPASAGATLDPALTHGVTYSCECNDGTVIMCGSTCAQGNPRRIVTIKVKRSPVQLVSRLVGYRPSELAAQGSVNVAAQ